MLQIQPIIFLFIMSISKNDCFDARGDLTSSLYEVVKKYFIEKTLLVIFDQLNVTATHKKLEPNLNINLRQSTLQRLETLNLTIQVSQTVRIPYDEEFPPVKLENTLLFLHDRTIMENEEMIKSISAIKQNPFWWPYGRTLILTEKLRQNQMPNLDWAKRVIDYLWKYTRNDDILVMVANRTYESIEFYTWFPYQAEECSRVETIVLLDVWKDGRFQTGHDLFPDKITTNLKGCSMKVVAESCIPYVIPKNYSVSDQNPEFVDGIEIKIINALSDVMNFKIDYEETPSYFYGGCDGDECYGAFKLLREQTIDLAFSCMMLNAERYFLAEPLPSYFDDSLIWFVPTPTLKSHLYDIFKAFSVEFWFCILIVFLSSIIVIIVISRIEKKIFKYKNPSAANHATKLVGLSVTNTPNFYPPGMLLRTFVFFFCIYSIHITTAFQASMFTLFRSNAFHKTFKTLKQAADSNLHAYLRGSTKQMYNKSDHDVWNKILRPGRYEYYDDDYEKAFNNTAENKNSMVLFIKSQGLYLVSTQYSNELGLPKILYLSERFSSYPVTMYMSPGSPLLPVFETIIYRLIASGLVEYWSKVVVKQKHLNKNRFNIVENKPLGLEHFSGAFYLHFGLLFLSLVTFGFEFLIFKVCRKKRKKLVRNCKKRTENVMNRINWFKSDISNVLNEFVYAEIRGKKEKLY